MVHWNRPTTPAMARQHKLQLPLLLEMSNKELQNKMQMDVCNLLLGGSRPSQQLVNASPVSSMRIVGE